MFTLIAKQHYLFKYILTLLIIFSFITICFIIPYAILKNKSQWKETKCIVDNVTISHNKYIYTIEYTNDIDILIQTTIITSQLYIGKIIYTCYYQTNGKVEFNPYIIDSIS